MTKQDKPAEPAKPKFQLPSAYEMAMLAATMKAGPEEALKLWYESNMLKEVMEEMDERRRRMFFAFFCRDFYEGEGFIDGEWLRSFNGAMREGITYSFKETMQMLDIHSEKTFFDLYRYHLNRRTLRKNETEAEKQAGIECAIRRAQKFARYTSAYGNEQHFMEEYVVNGLKKSQREKRAAIGRQNKVNAVTKGKRRTLSK